MNWPVGKLSTFVVKDFDFNKSLPVPTVNGKVKGQTPRMNIPT